MESVLEKYSESIMNKDFLSKIGGYLGNSQGIEDNLNYPISIARLVMDFKPNNKIYYADRKSIEDIQKEIIADAVNGSLKKSEEDFFDLKKFSSYKSPEGHLGFLEEFFVYDGSLL